MKFVNVRELRSNTATIRQDLAQAREIILTVNGRPFALMTPVEPETVEEELQAIRRARARAAVDRLRAQAKAAGADRLAPEAIDAEIAAARRSRRRGR
jgi:antitoxin (DNA-binding transcriptional repressor) of toxin-antitoxin stability system